MLLQSLLPEEFQKRAEIEQILRTKYSKQIDQIFIFQAKNQLELNVIKIKPEFKNQGWGKKIMTDLCSYADKHDLIITLTPSDSFGSNVGKLKAFYKAFNFQFNAGKNKIHTISDSMYRLPNNMK